MNEIANSVWISMGSNVGDSLGNFKKAIEEMKNLSVKIQVEKVSTIFKTQAWGNSNQPDFLNCVVELKTFLSANELLMELLSIEKKMGRVRMEKWGPRIIDLDILFYGSEIHENEVVQIPHRELHNRKFVLIPLAELIPNFVHPVFRKNISQLLLECQDESSVLAAAIF